MMPRNFMSQEAFLEAFLRSETGMDDDDDNDGKGTDGLRIASRDDREKSLSDALSNPTGLHPHVQVLSVQDLVACTVLEHAAFPPEEQCSREKLLYRLKTCPELCLGLFSTIAQDPSSESQPFFDAARAPDSSNPKHKSLLLAQVLATLTTAPTVTDASMEMASSEMLIPSGPQVSNLQDPNSQISGLQTSGTQSSGLQAQDPTTSSITEAAATSQSSRLADQPSSMQTQADSKSQSSIVDTSGMAEDATAHSNENPNADDPTESEANPYEVPEPPLDPRPGHQPQGQTLAIHSVCVAPWQQKSGLGKMLFKAYLQRMEGAALAKRAAIVCHPDLVGWYVGNFGFVDKGESKVTWGHGGWHDLIYEFSDIDKD